jgi:hypothetical protein
LPPMTWSVQIDNSEISQPRNSRLDKFSNLLDQGTLSMSTWSPRSGFLVSCRKVNWTAVSAHRFPCILSLAPRALKTPLRRVMLPSSSPANRLSIVQRHFTMNAQELKNFLADSPPTIVNLEIRKHFEALTDQQARYAHYISRYVIYLAPIFSRPLGIDTQYI